ncbi:uncharacterized protein [Temnothorax longispinosus]|uniref:uncharacterized protein isoform X2 n=1 Tax=Temnothorax longispinosus TaxID=300112 RepID=UPI003A98D056
MNFCSRRRFRITPMRALAAFFLMVVLFWYSLSRQEIPQQPCSVPEEFTEKLHDLAYRAHLVLTKLGIVHFLCLGGLWGQVRIGRALPWARKVELCLVDTLRDDVLITKTFREVGLSATYLHAAGIYRIQEHEVGEDAPKVEVVVFEEDAVSYRCDDVYEPLYTCCFRWLKRREDYKRNFPARRLQVYSFISVHEGFISGYASTYL